MNSIIAVVMETSGKNATPRRDGVFWFVVAAGFIYGAVYNFLPVTFPVFRSQFQATFEQLGRTQFVFLISSLVISVMGGWLAERAGLKRAALVSLLLLAAGLAIIGSAGSIAGVFGGCFVFGAGVACLVLVSSSLITGHFGDRRQSVFFAFGIADAVGAIVGPALLGQWIGPDISNNSWRTGYVATAAITVLLGIWSLRLRYSPGETAGSTESPWGAMGTVLGSPAIYLIGAAMLFHSIAQVGMTSWVGVLFRETRDVSAGEAAWFLSLNSAGFLVGRTILGLLTARYRIPELVILFVCALCGTIAFALTIKAPSYATGLVLFAIAGFFISGDSPTINSFVGRNWTIHTATAFAILGGMGNLGGAAGPYVTGLIGNHFGIEIGIRIMPLFSFALAMLSIGWYRFRRNTATPQTVAAEKRLDASTE